ncbi:hypothetical protein [Lysobacter sp. P5_B9]
MERFFLIAGTALLAGAMFAFSGCVLHTLYATGNVIASADDTTAAPWLAPIFFIMLMPNIRPILLAFFAGGAFLIIGGVIRYNDKKRR